MHVYTPIIGQHRGTVILSQFGMRSPSFSSGLVEVLVTNGPLIDSHLNWRTVCHDGITSTEAEVICHQLGYVSAESFDSSEKYIS